MLEAVYSILNSTASITDIVGTSIYPLIREEETDMPALMMETIAISPIDTNSGAKATEYRVDVHSYSQTVQQSNALMLLVRSALDRVEGDHAGYSVAFSHVTGMDLDVVAGGRVYTSTTSVSFHVID